MSGIGKRRIENTSGLFEVYIEGGGRLPTELEGVFTSEKLVDIAVNGYLIKKQDKATKVKRRA